MHRNSVAAASGRTLPKAAARLLAVLAEPGVTAAPDPSRDGFVVLRGAAGGISLGRGAAPRPALDALIRRDLAERIGRREVFAVSAAGRAWLVREAGRRGRADPDAYARQHRDLRPARVATETGEAEVAINAQESPLAWLRRRRGPDGEPLIDAAAFEAGERLRRDVTLAGILPSVTARWDGAVGGGAGAVRDPAAAADATIAARQRVRKALAAVGSDFADLLLDLCGFLKGVETIERERRWPQRSGKVVIRLALAQLARHYGLSNVATGRESRRLHAWFAEEDAA